MNPWKNGTYLPTDLPIKNQSWMDRREIYVPFVPWMVWDFCWNFINKFLGGILEGFIFCFCPFLLGVGFGTSKRIAEIWVKVHFRCNGEDENQVTHIFFIQLAWYQHDTESDVVEDMLFQVNLLSISWYRLQQLLLGCVSVWVLLCLQQFSKSLKISLGGARLSGSPYLHCPCKL